LSGFSAMGASFERGSILGLFLGLSTILRDPRNTEVGDYRLSTVHSLDGQVKLYLY
jgi:hypothetical protein